MFFLWFDFIPREVILLLIAFFQKMKKEMTFLLEVGKANLSSENDFFYWNDL